MVHPGEDCKYVSEKKKKKIFGRVKGRGNLEGCRKGR